MTDTPSPERAARNRRQEVWVFALTATLLLLAFGWWRAQGGFGGAPVDPDATCEERCMANDAGCAEVAEAQGGFPDPALSSADRRARCRGLCLVLRATATDPGANACLK